MEYMHVQRIGKPLEVPIDRLYTDPNNPRLALKDKPGYADPAKLFEPSVRDRIFSELGDTQFAVGDLVEAIIGQGWTPIDSILVWKHPARPKDYVVVEGNRRRLALNRVRTVEIDK